MNTGATLVLAAVYVFKTILRIDSSEYKAAFDSLKKEMEGKLETLDDKTEVERFFNELSKPNNIGLLHMVLMSMVVGINETYDINSNMPNLGDYLKSHNVLESEASFTDIDLKYILRRMRNSISHYRYKFDGTKFTFEDSRPSGEDYFKAEFTHLELAELIDNISFFCVNNFNLKTPL